MLQIVEEFLRIRFLRRDRRMECAEQSFSRR